MKNQKLAEVSQNAFTITEAMKTALCYAESARDRLRHIQYRFKENPDTVGYAISDLEKSRKKVGEILANLDRQIENLKNE